MGQSAALGRLAVPLPARHAPGSAVGALRDQGRAGARLVAALGGGYFKTSYEADLALVDTRLRRVALGALVVALLVLPRFASGFVLDLVSQAAFAAIGALALNVLTGLAGQISLGHAGFLAAGAFTTAALVERGLVSPLVTLPATALVGGVLGLVVGMPSLRLKGLYLALGTLAMHHVVLYAAGEMQARAGGNTGFTIPPPRLGGLVFRGTVAWYYALVVLAALVLLLVVNLQRSRAGRAWMAIRDRDVAAASVGIDVARYKLSAFVWSSVVTALAGALFAYHRGFVSVEAFGFFVAVEYIAMIIIGGLGSALGAVLGAAFVTLLPYVIDALVAGVSPDAAQYYVFPAKFGAFGLLMALFLLFEPLGLVGIWRRVRNWFALWPFRHRPLRASS
ncbi:MAG: branched-chain amino acid ABC transporter permease [Candidatus Rokuibacteriota bacterium]|nr:MAG: branched-chain amino acid ABC transporter permease [Candidatus Rokubacteria bacterium]